MFDRLKKALTKTISEVKTRVESRVAYKEIKESDIADILDELFLELVEADIAYEVAEEIVDTVKQALLGTRVKRGSDLESVVKDALRRKLLEILDKPFPDLVEEAKARRPGDPLIIVFLGVNGVGKTTTIAKIAYKMKRAGVTPVLAAADTFRAGAQEQLGIHAERVGVPLIRGRYGSDPASVAHDAISYARARGYKAVLIDTAGRMHVDYDLMGELRKIVRVSKPHYKILVVDSLTGNDAVEQAKRFDAEVGIDAVILTKLDADVKGGTAVSVAAVTGKPVAYVGVGQGYDDIERFDARKFVDEILS